MNNRISNTAFENLMDYPDLRKLIDHILASLDVTEVKVFVPSTFDTTLIEHPDYLVPVREIVIGNVALSYIRYRAQDILAAVQEKIQKIKQDEMLSISDKLTIFKNVKAKINFQYRYFNSMNPIRYMSSYTWMIVYTVEEECKTIEKREEFPNSKMDFQEQHRNILNAAFNARKHLLEELLYLVDEQLLNLEDNLTETKYEWKDQEPYEIHELLVALIESNRIKYCKGDEKTFVHDFLAFFGVSDEKFAYKKGKVLQRIHRSHLLHELDSIIENYGKPTALQTSK